MVSEPGYDNLNKKIQRRNSFTLTKQMDMENTQSNIVARLSKLKLNDYEMWRFRIEQYFLVQDYPVQDCVCKFNVVYLYEPSRVEFRARVLVIEPSSSLNFEARSSSSRVSSSSIICRAELKLINTRLDSARLHS